MSNTADFPEKITIGEKYDRVAKVNTPQEASAFFDKCVRHQMLFTKNRDEAITIERINIGYYAGYFSMETRERVENLFGFRHPIITL